MKNEKLIILTCLLGIGACMGYSIIKHSNRNIYATEAIKMSEDGKYKYNKELKEQEEKDLTEIFTAIKKNASNGYYYISPAHIRPSVLERNIDNLQKLGYTIHKDYQGITVTWYPSQKSIEK